MTLTRPCTCDRFAAGFPYRPGRDCSKCWMYAHRPAIRQAWGGNPDDCAAMLSVRPDMHPTELADLLAGPPLAMPDGWRFWPSIQAAHRILVERCLTTMPCYPEGRFSGRGAIICGGGRYEAGVYVACRMLRHVGWEHPMQVWHRGQDEPVSDRVRRLPGVEVVDAEAHPARAERRHLAGWEVKSFAILNCPFEEVLYLDADCYPIFNPDTCFAPAHNPHGIVTWPDSELADNAIHWPTYGLASDGKTSLNGGHYVLVKRRAWPVFHLSAHFDNHSEFYYWGSIFNVAVGAFGDQEHIRIALHMLGVPYHRYAARPISCVYDSYVQAGPHGAPLFVHRFGNKFGLPGQFGSPPRWYAGDLPMEATAWQYFLQWLTEPPAQPSIPEEVPGWFSTAECELWSRCCRDRDVLELGRYQGRSTTAAALTARRVVSIDVGADTPADFWLQRYGVRHKVWLRQGSFADLISDSGGPFSACLIGGAHDLANLHAEIAAVVPHLKPGAVIGFHGYSAAAFPEVRKIVEAVAARQGWHRLDRADSLDVFVTS